MRILVDMDNIIADILTPWLKSYNWKFNDHLTVSDIKEWEMVRVVKPECGDKIFSFIHEPDFYLNLDPLPGAIEGVKALTDAGEEVVVCTSSPSGCAMWEKERWLRKHFPFLNTHKQYGCWTHKSWIRCTAIIDDCPATIRAFAEEQPDTIRATITWPWTASVASLCHINAEDWQDTAKAWKTLVQELTKPGAVYA